MDINKTFYIEQSEDGSSYIHNVGQRFFTYRETVSADSIESLIAWFKPSQKQEMKKYISKLKAKEWTQLTYDEIKLIRLGEGGRVIAYPFPYRKGYVSIEELEKLAAEKQYKWDYKDHATNPFSALLDYSYFLYNICMTNISSGTKYDTEALRSLLDEFKERLSEIGAIDTIENYFSKIGYVPDPRRFDDNSDELMLFYHRHLDDCSCLACTDFLAQKIDLETVIRALQEIQTQHKCTNEKFYEIQDKKIHTSNQRHDAISTDPYS